MLDILAMRGGVSDEFTKLELFPCYCREAHYAVHHGADRADSHLLYFQNWKLDYIIEHAVGELKKEMLIPQSFFQLIELDQQKKTNYLQTLEVFLKENMNGYKAAQELYIHRNTLMARMSHIEQILGVDLNDYDTRFLVELYIKLYRAE